jgi:hypothetical protein
MALLAVTAITKAGVEQDGAAVAADVAGDSVVASSGIFVQVTNGDASSHTATVTKPAATTDTQNFGSLTLSDIVITIPAGETRSFTIPPGYASSNTFEWAYDDVTSMTVAVFSIA